MGYSNQESTNNQICKYTNKKRINDSATIISMNPYSGTDKDIHTRIYRFILDCHKDIVRKIPKSTENLPIISQLASSLTSIGANDQEADASGSKKDFIAKYKIVKKEAKETHYWLCFVRDSSILKHENLDAHIQECKEILLIISKIINNSERAQHL